jgi:hypothetical protein
MTAMLQRIKTPRCRSFKKGFGLYRCYCIEASGLKMVEIEVLSSDHSGTGMVIYLCKVMGCAVCIWLMCLPNDELLFVKNASYFYFPKTLCN